MTTSLFPSYWLISVPAEQNKNNAFQKFDSATGSDKGLSKNFKFDIPELKVGTLDSLMQISDELGKHDLFAESTVNKLANNLSNLLERDQKALESNLSVNQAPVRSYLEKFPWNEAKYPIKNSIKDLVDTVMKQLGEIDNEMKSKMSAYNAIKTNLANLERKQTGNLLVRSLTDVVDKKYFVLDSEFLTTLLVVVPKHNIKEWKDSYETQISQMVVPRSSEMITEDRDYALFTVTLFKRFVDDFKQAARERKFIVRDFEYKEEEIETERKERSQLGSDLKKQLATLTRWCKTNFSEAFEAWIHLKALRIFVESVLRYGLPPNFQAVILEPNMKNEKKLRSTLNSLYEHLEAKQGDDKKKKTSSEPSEYLAQAGDFFSALFSSPLARRALGPQVEELFPRV